MICNCSDWKDNIDKVNAPFIYLFARNPQSQPYNGKVFIYCPWCGNKLEKLNEINSPESK